MEYLRILIFYNCIPDSLVKEYGTFDQPYNFFCSDYEVFIGLEVCLQI
jgi:hypothetical protein